MNVLIDPNLSPRWCTVLEAHGHRTRPASGAAKYGARW